MMHYPTGACGGAAVKNFLVLATLCFGLAIPAFSQQGSDSPATKEDVEKYLQAIHSHEMMKQMAEAMSKPMHNMVHEQYLKDKDKLPADFEDRMNKVMDNMMKEMPFDQMMDAMIPTYQKHFTTGDMEALTAFYSAPVGQKVLRELPSIMSESMENIMPLMRKNIEHMTAQVQEQVAQMMKQPSQGTSQATPSTKN